ncbi:unnamed protein product [Rhizophagus irregularis]|nr:unnamed protein product [Rhizophagus irregularis]
MDPVCSTTFIKEVITQKIDSFVNFDIYTDGSYNNSLSTNEFHMGYGWHISNIMDFDLFYHGAIEHFPSSTKAEIIAILTALIILPPHSSVNIFTDFQAAIEGYKKSSQLHFISPRRYNKINYISLWSVIHDIIKKLSLKLTLIKVKAHSHSAYHDKADELAKVGRLKPIPTAINSNASSTQSVSLVWNDEVVLDKDIRKNMGKIIDYRWIDNHLTHNNLTDIYTFTQRNMINWDATSRFFHLNSRNDSTCSLHSKDLSWKVKSSTNMLPTFDILNQNFPDLITDKDTNCLLCNNTLEMQTHLWTCPVLLPHIRETFKELAIIAQGILQKNADKLNLCITDSIKYSYTFRWSLRDNETITDNAILLLRSYITEDLYRSFRTHFNTHKSTIKFLLEFVDVACRLIKGRVWKIRSAAWKNKNVSWV